MNADFFDYSIHNRFIQRQPCACVRKLFVFEKLLLKLLTGFLPNFTGMSLR